jgi:ComF family protein
MRVGVVVREAATAVVDLLLPDVCNGCDAAPPVSHGLCEPCSIELMKLCGLPYCPRCGSTLGPHIEAAFEEGCFACPSPLPRFARTVRLGPYAAPLRHFVRELKYRRQVAMLRRLGRLLGEAVDGCDDVGELDVVVPIPSYWSRRLLRGIDHAVLLAGAVAEHMDLPIAPALRRVRNTRPQVGCSRTKRIENVRQAFQAVGGDDLAGARVLLIDDVTTTGATASECARTLLQAGAVRVTLAVVAKSEPYDAYAPRLHTPAP